MTMKTIAGVALGLIFVGGCGPDGSLELQSHARSLEASTYLAAPSCGPAKVSTLLEVLPDEKIIGALEVDLNHLRRSPLFTEIEGLLAAEAADVLGAMKECGVPLSKVDGIIFGFSEDEDVVLAAKAKGLGDPSTLDCLAKKIEKASGESPWSRVTHGCSTTLKITDGESKGFVVGRDIVVFASKSLETSVERRVQGNGKSALDGRLSWVRREVDTSTSAWMAVNLSPTMAAGMSSSMAGVTRVGLDIDASKGLGLSMGAGFGRASQAKAAAKELESQIGQVKAMLPLVGLPSTVGDSIAISSKGNFLRLGMFLAPSDVDALRKAIEGATGGGSTSTPTPPPGKRSGI